MRRSAAAGCFLVGAGLTREEKLRVRNGALGETHACFPTPLRSLTLWPYAYFFARNGIAASGLIHELGALRARGREIREREGDRDQSAGSVWSRKSDMHDH